MAPNVTITEHEATLDEINREVEASRLTDNPDALSITITRLAHIAREQAEQVDAQQWDRQHPWRSALGQLPWLCLYIAISCGILALTIDSGWQPNVTGALGVGVKFVVAASVLAAVNAVVKRVLRGGDAS